MAIALDGQNIIVSGNATHTWDEAVALGSTLMTAHALSNARTLYRWQGLMRVIDTATLNIDEKYVDIFRDTTIGNGQIRAEGSGVVNIRRSQISCTSRTDSINTNLLSVNAPTARINLEETQLFLGFSNRSGADRINIALSSLRGSSIVGSNTFTSQFFLYFPANGTIENSFVHNCSFEVDPLNSNSGTSLNVIGSLIVKAGNAAASFGNWAVDNYIIRDYLATGGVRSYSRPTDVSTTFVDSQIDLTNGSILVQSLPNAGKPSGENKKAVSSNLKTIDSDGPVENALVSYTGRTNASATSDAAGLVDEFILTIEETAIIPLTPPGAEFSYVEYSRPIPIVDYSAYNLAIKSYRHASFDNNISLTSRVGTSANPLDTVLIVDEGVTEPNITTVGSYSGIAYSGSTYTLSGTLTTSQVYDWAKRNWRLNAGVHVPTKEGGTANFGTAAITINAPANLPATTAKFTQFTTTGIITLAAPGDYSATPITVPATGEIQVADGTTNLSSSTFASGAEINLAHGATAATVLVGVGQEANITAGTGVTISAPTNSIVVSGIPQVTGAILAVINLITDAVTYPTLTSGGATIELDEATNYLFAADAPGYLRQAVTLPGNTPTFVFGLTNYRALYEAGVNRSADIGFNYSTLAVTIGDGTANLSFADVFRTIEDYLATEEGVLFANPPYPVIVDVGGGSGRNYLFFPYDEANDQVNPVVIRPDPTNTTDPTLTDFVIVLEGATAPLFDIFDFTLAGGRTIRFQTEAVAAIINLTQGSSGNTLNPDLPALNISLGPARTGLTITAILIEDNAAVGSPIACPESATVPGHYSGDMPEVPAGVYGVRFLSAGEQVGTGVIDWDGTKERGLGDLPTVAQVEARTLPSGDYFNPATDAVATVTSITNAVTLPSIPANWITAAGLAADATEAIWAQSGRTLDGTQATQLANLDAAVSSRSTYAGSDTPGTVTLVSRLTSARAGYLDKLNVTGTLANSDAAATYRADVSGLLTAAAYTPPPTTAAIWSYEGRSLDGAQAATLVTIEGAALAVADGRFAIDYLNSTATQYNDDGTTRTVFDLYDADGNLATTPESAVDRRPI